MVPGEYITYITEQADRQTSGGIREMFCWLSISKTLPGAEFFLSTSMCVFPEVIALSLYGGVKINRMFISCLCFVIKGAGFNLDFFAELCILRAKKPIRSVCEIHKLDFSFNLS